MSSRGKFSTQSKANGLRAVIVLLLYISMVFTRHAVWSKNITFRLQKVNISKLTL